MKKHLLSITLLHLFNASLLVGKCARKCLSIQMCCFRYVNRSAHLALFYRGKSYEEILKIFRSSASTVMWQGPVPTWLWDSASVKDNPSSRMLLPHCGKKNWPPYCRWHFQIHFLGEQWIQFSHRFISKDPINNKSLVLVKFWCRTRNDKPVTIPVCVTRLRWINLSLLMLRLSKLSKLLWWHDRR